MADLTGVRASNALIAQIYTKHSKISNATNKKFDSGEIVTFVQVDSDRLFWLCFQLADIVQVPFVLGCAFSFAFYFFGVDFFAGISVFALASVLFLAGAAYQNSQYTIYMRRKDRRMKVTTESINNIKMLKLYSW